MLLVLVALKRTLAEEEAAVREMEIAAAASEMEGLPRHDSPLAHRSHESAPGGTQEAEKRSSPLPASPLRELHRFFSTPSLPLLQPAPPLHQPRLCRTYGMTNVRHSARLAAGQSSGND
ncbi:hypothetical protein BS78_01G231300 [Paspalum vaginatum]|nr:hypothetical protein BS78_01G231300 [Paspalum vaginatum]